MLANESLKDKISEGKVSVNVISATEIRTETKKYNPDTGEEIEPQVNFYTKEVLEENLKTFKSQVENSETILSYFSKK